MFKRFLSAFVALALLVFMGVVGLGGAAQAASLPDLACTTTGQTEGTAAWDETVVDAAEYMLHHDAVTHTVHHDFVPGHWWNWSPNKEQGPFDGPPSFPTDDRGTWTEHDNGGPGQDQVGVFQQGKGHGSWFYRAEGVAAYDEVVVDTAAYDETIPAVTHTVHHDAVAGNPGTESCSTWVTWQTPNFVPVNPSWNSVGQPQTFVGFGQLTPQTCETTYQQDLYVGSRAAINSVLADDLLTGGPEDSGVVQQWAFVSTDWCPPVIPSIVPDVPKVKDLCETVQDHYGLPSTEGVIYTRDGKDIIGTLSSDDSQWGELGDWTLQEDGTIRYAFNSELFTDVNCETEVPVPAMFSADPTPPTCADAGSFDFSGEFPNVDVTVSPEYDGPGVYELTADTAAGYEFPDGTTHKERTITVDPATGVTQSEDADAPCYLAVTPTPTPTPTETPTPVSNPVPTQTTAPVVVNELDGPDSLAHTGSTWDALAPYALAFMILGIALAITAFFGRRWEKSHHQQF